MNKLPKMLSLQMNMRPEDFAPVTKEEQAQLVRSDKSMTYWQDAWRRLKQNKVAMTAMFVIIIFILFAFIGPMFSPYSYDQQIRGKENLAPSMEHWLGTDNLGRDMMVRVMIGSRISLSIGVVASLIVLVIGSAYGAISGLAGGIVDNIMMRLVELIYSVPDVLIVILLSVVLKGPLSALFDSSSFFKGLHTIGAGLISIFITFGLLYWVGMARIVRAQVLMLKEQEFVTAARALGASNKRIIMKHLLPNCIGPIIVTTMLTIPSAIFLESFLSFLGLGVSAPLASLGSLASDAMSGIYSYTYRLIAPSLAICVIILSFNLFGDGLRDALDPRLKK